MSENVVVPHDVHPLVARVEKTIRAKGLLSPNSRVLISVSGGPDSVGLLALLVALRLSWRLDLHVLHVNHGLRGEESEGDAVFVMQCCEKLGVTFHQKDCPMPQRGIRGERPSVQETAREARYEALSQVGLKVGAQRIALGHTADDQAETVLMWMIRGAGGKGLAGMPSVREGRYVRPLLAIRRADIMEYLHKSGVAFRVDSSNSNLRYVRNRIRQQVIPMLQELNPGIVNVLNRQAEIVREEDLFLDGMVKIQLDRLNSAVERNEVVIPRSEFLMLVVPLQRRMVREIMYRVTDNQKGPGFDAVSAVLQQIILGPTGVTFGVQGVRVTRDYDRIHWSLEKTWQQEQLSVGSKRLQAQDGLPLAIPGFLVWPLTGQGLSARVLKRGDEEWPRLESDASPAHRALFDASLVQGSLQVRGWIAGDVFCPLGMGGKQKKLQDFFTDMKLPRAQRHQIPLVVGRDGIIWVTGHRIDQRYRVSPRTQAILCLEIEPRIS